MTIMKLTNKLMVAAGMAVLATVTSCNQADELVPETPAENINTQYPFQAKMVLDGGVQHHDETRASTGWQDNDIIYLQFRNDEQTVSGMASYSSKSDAWTIQCTKEPPSGEGTYCEAYFFENEGNTSYAAVQLSHLSTIYAEKAGTYTLTDGTINVKATLKPMTGRIRFQGKASTEFTVGGIYYYTGYDIRNNSFEVKYTSTLNTIGADGYSPYVYGSFLNDKRRLLYIGDENDSILYTQSTKMSCMAPGHSGCMQMPTQEAHHGWQAQEYVKKFTVNGVSFNMILVQGGTFNMGATPEQYLYDMAPDNNELPVHRVTLSTYYIAETEVTNELWKAVTGMQKTDNEEQYKYPAGSVSHSDAVGMATQLTWLTGQPFRLPTEAEWEYAARGGARSKGFMYAGSNFLDMVGWGGNTRQTVATKAPNELGIYDMSGNVSEWCADRYGDYSSEDQTDPTGPTTGSTYIHRGSSNNNGYFSSYSRVSSRQKNYSTYDSEDTGLRLAL